MTDPSYHEYGFFAWVKDNWRDFFKRGWYNGYARCWDEKGALLVVPEVHLWVSAWLYHLSGYYRDYVEHLRAHEWGHAVGVYEHEARPDLMAPSVLRTFIFDEMKDKHRVFQRSRYWRERIRGKTQYAGS